MSFSDQNPSNVITGHIAWHGTLNQFMSELFLHAHKPMSYILWQSGQKNHYFFSYVMDIFTTHHQRFFFDLDSLVWKYASEQIIYQEKDLYKILQSIMGVNLSNHWQPIIHASKKSIHTSDFPK